MLHAASKFKLNALVCILMYHLLNYIHVGLLLFYRQIFTLRNSPYLTVMHAAPSYRTFPPNLRSESTYRKQPRFDIRQRSVTTVFSICWQILVQCENVKNIIRARMTIQSCRMWERMRSNADSYAYVMSRRQICRSQPISSHRLSCER